MLLCLMDVQVSTLYGADMVISNFHCFYCLVPLKQKTFYLQHRTEREDKLSHLILK